MTTTEIHTRKSLLPSVPGLTDRVNLISSGWERVLGLARRDGQCCHVRPQNTSRGGSRLFDRNRRYSDLPNLEVTHTARPMKRSRPFTMRNEAATSSR